LAGSPGASDPIHGPAATRGTSPSASARATAAARGRHDRRTGHEPPTGTRPRHQPAPTHATPPADTSSSAPATGLAPAAAHPSDAGGEALPVWLAPAGIAALFVAAGGTALVRRRRGASAH
jgi:hypothetical protein